MPATPKSLPLEVIAHHAGGRPAQNKPSGVSAAVQFLDNNVTESTLITDAKGAVYWGITCAKEKANGGLLRSRNGGWTFDGFMTLCRNSLESELFFFSTQTSPMVPIQYNRLAEPCEFIGAALASFARDICIIDESSDAIQCDGDFDYN